MTTQKYTQEELTLRRLAKKKTITDFERLLAFTTAISLAERIAKKRK